MWQKLQTVKWDQWLFSRILFIYYLIFVCGGSCMGFSLVLESGGYLPFAGPRHHCSGFSVAACGLKGAWFPAAVAHGFPAAAPGSRAQAQWLRCTGLAACHVGSSQFRDGNCLLHWQVDSFPLRHQGSPRSVISEKDLWSFGVPLWQLWVVMPSPWPELEACHTPPPTLISTRAPLFPSDSFIYWQHFIQNTIHVKITHPLSFETTEADLFIIFFHLKNVLIQLPLSTSINNWVEGTVYSSCVSIHLDGGKTVLFLLYSNLKFITFCAVLSHRKLQIFLHSTALTEKSQISIYGHHYIEITVLLDLPGFWYLLS